MKRILWIFLFLFLLTGCISLTKDIQPSSTAANPEPTATTSIPPLLPSLPAGQPSVPTLPATEPDILETEPTVPEFDPGVILQSMTLEEKVGQLFLGACPSTNALEDIQTYHLGGYLLFGNDFNGQTPESLAETTSAYQNASKIPLLIAVDEEGGTVCRVSSNSGFRKKRFSSPRTLYSKGGMELILSTEEEKCQLLKELGINVNMAPVCDITTDPGAFMYKRSLGETPQVTGEYAAAMVAVMDSWGIGSVLKHFPGYGNNVDTHTGIAVDSRDLQSLEENDLIPFRAGIEAGCGAILVSHTIVECLDEACPASLSASVHTFLRSEMGFEGVILTDDLTMGAITDRYGAGEAAVLAVLAGNDLLCTFDYRAQYTAVLEAVRSGRISEEILGQSVCRILQWKHDLGLL